MQGALPQHTVAFTAINSFVQRLAIIILIHNSDMVHKRLRAAQPTHPLGMAARHTRKLAIRTAFAGTVVLVGVNFREAAVPTTV